MARLEIHIPVRPKAVQSVRGSFRGFYADPAVKKWKKAIEPYIRAVAPARPSRLPIRIVRLDFLFKYPQSTRKRVREFIDDGGLIPYLGHVDITDNLAKGLMDVCAGIIFENDQLIWETCGTRKLYAPQDGIVVVFEETPGITLIDGTLCDEHTDVLQGK